MRDVQKKQSSKKWLIGCAVALLVVAMPITAFATATYQTPAEAVAGVTGQTVEQVLAERQDGKSYGTIAAEAGKLEDYQAAILETKQAELAARVAAGTMTQAQADTILANMTQAQAICDGSGNGGGCGMGYGMGNGNGYARGGGRGMGYASGYGMARCSY